MSKRLQVLLEEAEWREIRRVARRRGTTVADWVRQALRAARRTDTGRDPGRKLDVIRHAVTHSFPTADIDQVLHEIERGYQDPA
jgi:hypothetical protein